MKDEDNKKLGDNKKPEDNSKPRTKQDFSIDDFIPSQDSLNSDYLNEKYNESWDSVNEQLKRKLVIAFLGTASSGKTSGIKALFNIDFGYIHPIPGSTTEVKVVEIQDNVYLVDAPGFGDINQKVSQKAKEACELVDIFVYVINSEGGYKTQEKDDYTRIVSLGKEVLVVMNKIDLLRDHQREHFLEDQRTKMGVKPENYIPVAFDPLPQISEHPINIKAVQEWIQAKLEIAGKDLLFAKIVRDKDAACDKWIKGACVSAGMIGALPIPGTDFIPLTAVQSAMIAKITKLYDHSVTKEDAVGFIGQAMAGQLGKQIFRVILTILKSTGWFPLIGWAATALVSSLAATMAISITYGLGKAAQAYYKNDMNIPIIDIQRIFADSFNEKRLEQE